LAAAQQVGFYGIDLYSLFTLDPRGAGLPERDRPEAAAARARALRLLRPRGEDSQAYGYAASFGLAPSCEDEVVQQLRDMNQRTPDAARVPGLERDQAFYAQQNARLVRNAEEYYRTMFHGACRRGTCGTATWWRRCRRWTAPGPKAAHRPHRGLGAQLAPGRRQRHRDGRRGNGMSASSCASAIPATPCWWASARTMAG
jgi:hypothetical protein